jgi:hypothetical protein
MFDKYQDFFKNNENSFKKRVVLQVFGGGSHHLHKVYHSHIYGTPARARRIEGDYYEWSAAQNKWDKILDYSPDAPTEWGPGNYDGEIRKA